MREKVRAMYASGELDRMLRYCGVKEKDLEDMRQLTAFLLLQTPPEKEIRRLGAYTISLIRKQYFGKDKHSLWWRLYRSYEERRCELQDSGEQVPQARDLQELGGDW